MKRVSKWLAILMVFHLLAIPALASQQTDVKIIVNGTAIASTDVNGNTVNPVIIDGTTYLPFQVLAESLGCTIDVDNAANTVIVSTGETQSAGSGLKVGAGSGKITFDPAMFPMEGFDGTIHDDPYIRVFLFENGEKTAFVSAELVTVGDATLAAIRELVTEKTGIPAENIWIASTHAITTPHEPSDEAAKAMMIASVTNAAEAALDQAVASFQPAVMGVGTCELDINVNRNIIVPDDVEGGPYYGLGSTEYSNKVMTMVRFDSLDGEPIGFYLSYGIKPTAIDNSEMDAGTRTISADIPGVACLMVEEEWNVPCMFNMPAAGDQYPKEMTLYYGYREDGTWGQIDLGVATGIDIVERLGAEMGGAAVKLAQSIDCTDADAVVRTAATVLTDTGAGDIPVSFIAIGDMVFVGEKPEIDAVTEQEIWASSPFGTTILVASLSSQSGPGKYMPHAAAYDFNNGKGTFEAQSARVKSGTAEQYVEAVLTVLQDLKSGAVNPDTNYSGVKIVVNGTAITPTDVNGNTVEPFVLDGTIYLPLRALAEALGYTVNWNAAASTITVSSETSAGSGLKVGAGSSKITFDPAMFPMEGFDGTIHDDPYIRVFLFENGEKTAFVSAELVTVGDATLAAIRELVTEKTGIPAENIWIASTHAITTPHEPSDEAAKAMMIDSVTNAAEAALDQAVASFQPAVMGVGTCELDINVNRNIIVPDDVEGGPYYGLGSTEYSNKVMTMVRFDSLDGEPIGFYLSYGIKPTAIDNSEMDAGTRTISADIPGVACLMVEEEWNVPCMFNMPAAGDQYPKEMTLYYGYREDGTWGQIDLGVATGIDIVERLGAEMGGAAVKLAQSIDCTDADAVVRTAATVLTDTGAGDIPVSFIAIGDMVFVGEKPEIDAVTEQEIWASSPFGTTILVASLSSQSGPGKYMPHAAAYDFNNGKGTFEAQSARVKSGTAEQYVEAVLTVLQDLKSGNTGAANDSQTEKPAEQESPAQETDLRKTDLELTAEELETSKAVEYLTNARCRYDEATKSFVLQFSLETYINHLSAHPVLPVLVDIRIVNSNGVTVYEATERVLAADYNGTVATVTVSAGDITASDTETGVVSYTVYNDGFSISKEDSVSNLPHTSGT